MDDICLEMYSFLCIKPPWFGLGKELCCVSITFIFLIITMTFLAFALHKSTSNYEEMFSFVRSSCFTQAECCFSTASYVYFPFPHEFLCKYLMQ